MRAAIKRHPSRPVGLLQVPIAAMAWTAVKHTDVVQPKEPASKDILATWILAIDPPREVDQQLLKGTRQEQLVALSRRTTRFVDLPNAPRMDRWIHVTQVPLVRRDHAHWDACTTRAKTAIICSLAK